MVTVAVSLAKKGEKEDRIATAIEEWLDGNKWAGRLFDENDWDFRLFVLDVIKVFRRHAHVH